MQTQLNLLFTPADFEALGRQSLDDAVCVVFDVLRATSSMLVALANGAETFIPVESIEEALEYKRRIPNVLLAGERNGRRILAEQTGGTDFDLGNSPREFTREKVEGKTIVSTTTNGTRALRACAGAKLTLVSGFLNLKATAARMAKERPGRLLLVCSGTFEETAYEDVLAAGALARLVLSSFPDASVSDAVHIAMQVYDKAAGDLLGAMQWARNARKLLNIPELREDVPFSLRRDVLDLVAFMDRQGRVRLMQD